MSAAFTTLQEIVTNRRTTKPVLMNGKIIDDAVVKRLLDLANWAPTHKNTEPWRFIVFSSTAKQIFCNTHAELYKNNTPAENFLLATYEKLKHLGENASHIIVAYVKRESNTKIPLIEEICAASAAVENILLAATALNIASFWSTGGMTHKPAFKNYFNLEEDDVVVGTIYLGYTNEHKQGKRITNSEQKTEWRNN